MHEKKFKNKRGDWVKLEVGESVLKSGRSKTSFSNSNTIRH
jgi:hypothetical protein